MVNLIVNSSGSRGNSYVIDAGGEILLIEAGIKARDILLSINFDRRRVVACLVSHDHISDHSKGVDDLLFHGIKVCSNQHLAENHHSDEIVVLPEKKWHTFGSFQVMPFSVHHDVPNYGYVIKHPEFGSLLFATDCNIIPTAFRGIKHFLIEANYSDAQLLLSDTDKAQKRRISEAHMSLESCVEYLHACKASATAQTVTLIHLSSRHSNSDAFQRRIEQEFGVPCYIARKGLTITLDDIL